MLERVPGTETRRRATGVRRAVARSDAHDLLVQRAVVQYATPTISARSLTGFHATAAAAIDHAHPTAVWPTTLEGQTVDRAIADALLGRAPAAVTGSAGARVARVA